MWFRCYVSSCLPPPSHGIPAFAPCSDVAHSKKDCGVAVPLWLWQPELIPEPLSWSEGGRQLLVAPLLKLHQTHTLFPVAKRRPGAQALFRGHGAHTHTRLHFLYEKHQAHSTDNVVMEKTLRYPNVSTMKGRATLFVALCCTIRVYMSARNAHVHLSPSHFIPFRKKSFRRVVHRFAEYHWVMGELSQFSSPPQLPMPLCEPQQPGPGSAWTGTPGCRANVVCRLVR